MSALQALAVARAHENGRGIRVGEWRHTHLEPVDMCRGLVLFGLGGEPAALAGWATGTLDAGPVLSTVVEPLNRQLLFGELLPVATEFNAWFESAFDADSPLLPQVLVANPGTATTLRNLGRRLAYQPSTQTKDGPPPVDPELIRFGQHLRFLTDHARLPGQALLVDAVTLVGQLWATPQTATERGHLPALMAWVSPPRGMPGFEAAAIAESAVSVGPLLDPEVENRILDDIERRRDAVKAGRSADATRAAARITAAYESHLDAAWELLRVAHALLQTVPEETRYAGHRHATDLGAYQRHVSWSRGPAQGRRRTRQTPLQTLDTRRRLEAAVAYRELHLAATDRDVRADLVVDGKAVDATLAAADLQRRAVPPGRRNRQRRPRLVLRTVPMPMAPTVDTILWWAEDPGRVGVIVADVLPHRDGSWEITVDVTNGLRAPKGGGSAPAEALLGAAKTGTRLAFVPKARVLDFLPRADVVPFTHDGPAPSGQRGDQPAGAEQDDIDGEG